MKKAFILLSLLFAVSGIRAEEPRAVGTTEEPRTVEYDGPHFAFEKTEHDFGKISHKSKKVEYRFEFTNDGTAPLVTTKVLTSCTCVKVDYRKKPVLPGEKGVIVVSYEVNKKEPGIFYKAVEVYSNSVDKRNNLVIKGNAVEDRKK